MPKSIWPSPCMVNKLMIEEKGFLRYIFYTTEDPRDEPDIMKYEAHFISLFFSFSQGGWSLSLLS